MTQTVPISWEDLLNAYQGPVGDFESQPLLDVSSGEITCPMLLDSNEAQAEIDNGRLIPLPIKDGLRGYEQRTAFAESLCDRALEDRLTKALNSAERFHAFDSVLAEVPVEALRWREEERLLDIELLYAWLTRAGLQPDPSPQFTRTIIEFPLKRPLPTDEE